jgi:hypothetical protein
MGVMRTQTTRLQRQTAIPQPPSTKQTAAPVLPSLAQHDFAKMRVQGQPESQQEAGNRPNCTPGPGIKPTQCRAYEKNRSWLPSAYVHNATCACQETPDSPSANCVRASLQRRLADTPPDLIELFAGLKWIERLFPITYAEATIAFLTPRIYADHVAAYEEGCCPSGPAPPLAWVGVTTVPLPCDAVGKAITEFGSCHGTPGAW